MQALELLCNEYRENKRLIEELTALNEGLKADIIAAMNGQDKMIVGSSKITNTLVNSTRLDSTAIKNNFPDIYRRYSKESSYYRFNII